MKERNQSIDLIKITGMMAVMGVHSTMLCNSKTITGFLLSTFCSGFSVLLFFMASGYLLGGKVVDYKYALKKIFGICRFVLTVAFLYWLVFGLRHGVSILTPVNDAILSLIQKGPFPMFWYFGAMIILYLFLPFYGRLVNRYSNFVAILIVALIVLGALVFVLNIGSDFEHKLVNQTFRVWNWFLYFSLGTYLKKHEGRDSIHVKWYYVIVPAVVHVLTVYLTRNTIGNTDNYYCTVTCVVYSYLVFKYLSQKQIHNNKIIGELSLLFLPVYTFHWFVFVYYGQFIDTSFMGEFTPLFNYIVASGLTVLLSLVVMRLPFAKSIFRI